MKLKQSATCGNLHLFMFRPSKTTEMGRKRCLNAWMSELEGDNAGGPVIWPDEVLIGPSLSQRSSRKVFSGNDSFCVLDDVQRNP